MNESWRNTSTGVALIFTGVSSHGLTFLLTPAAIIALGLTHGGVALWSRKAAAQPPVLGRRKILGLGGAFPGTSKV